MLARLAQYASQLVPAAPAAQVGIDTGEVRIGPGSQQLAEAGLSSRQVAQLTLQLSLTEQQLGVIGNRFQSLAADGQGIHRAPQEAQTSSNQREELAHDGIRRIRTLQALTQ